MIVRNAAMCRVKKSNFKLRMERKIFRIELIIWAYFTTMPRKILKPWFELDMRIKITNTQKKCNIICSLRIGYWYMSHVVWVVMNLFILANVTVCNLFTQINVQLLISSFSKYNGKRQLGNRLLHWVLPVNYLSVKGIVCQLYKICQ